MGRGLMYPFGWDLSCTGAFAGYAFSALIEFFETDDPTRSNLPGIVTTCHDNLS